MLVRLIYASQVASTMQAQDVQAILITARRRNAEDKITGMLCHGNNRFVQCVEGNRDVINKLYERLIKDTRHDQLVLLDYSPIFWRSFDNWSMGFVSLREADIQGIVRKITRSDNFFPERLKSSQALKLLKSFKRRLNPQFPVRNTA